MVTSGVISSVPACRHCSRAQLNIAHGRYGYYYKCLACDKNTPIGFTCPTCGTKTRIRKDGLTFHSECRCGYAAVVHTNTVA